ncbi:MAG: hypothetical protein WD801_08235 [Gemmatimonadaceae bacterium]
MRNLVLAALALSTTACGLRITTARDPKPDPGIEALYARGLAHLDPSNAQDSLDSAAGLLEAYVAHGGYVQRRREAEAMLNLTRSARQLILVEAALAQAESATDTVVRTRTEPGARDAATLREIERLKNELAKANAELERIRRRLATPPPRSPQH